MRRRGGGWGSAGGCRAVEPLQKMFRGSEPQDLLARYLHGFAGSGVPAHPGIPDLAGETAKAPELGPVALGETVGDLVQDRVNSGFHHRSGQMQVALSKFPDQFRADHEPISYF